MVAGDALRLYTKPAAILRVRGESIFGTYSPLSGHAPTPNSKALDMPMPRILNETLGWIIGSGAAKVLRIRAGPMSFLVS